jgi:Cof subfamily protein (haloacid dehalogenase superfamily)
MAELEAPSQRISLLLADVDGTLVTEDRLVTRQTQQAAEALQAAGVALAITSARPPRGMAMLVEPLAIETPIAGFNGGVIVTPDMAMLEERVLAPEVARRAVALVLDHRMDAWVYTGKDWLLRDPEASHVAREQSAVRFSPRVVRDFEPALARAAKIVGVSDDEDLVARCERDAQDAFGAHASAVRSQAYYLDITHPDANKGAVVDALSRILSIPSDEIATIGDMPNDVLMFRKSGLSIAMGNAGPAVKEQAHFATDSCNDEGFAKAVERFVLGRAPSAHASRGKTR